MKIVLILTFATLAFSSASWTLDYNSDCTQQTAVVTLTDTSTTTYNNWMADCPSTIASPADDSAYGCSYYAQYWILTLGASNTFTVEVTVVSSPTGSETLASEAGSSGADAGCGTGTATSGSSSVTCTWTSKATNTYWTTALTTTTSGALSAASFSDQSCGDGSSAFAWAGFTSTVMLF